MLIFSAHWLIQSSVKLSRVFSLSPLFIGLVIIAFGTSAPEAGVSVVAAAKGARGIALGNIIGSNIANIGLILGLCACLRPLRVDRVIIRHQAPIMFASVVLFYFLARDMVLSRMDGGILLFCFFIFLVVSYRGAKSSAGTEELDEFKFEKLINNIKSRALIITIVVFSVAGVVWGADLMVRGGVQIAYALGIKPWVAGMTIFAIGTSLPELAASFTATLHRVNSIGVGNSVGSNIFNILFILGVVALVRPVTIEKSVFGFEFPALFLFSSIIIVMMYTGGEITRREGIALVAGYILFLALLGPAF